MSAAKPGRLPLTDPRQSGPRLGLCCVFRSEPRARFRTTTATALKSLNPVQSRQKLRELCHANFLALRTAIAACAHRGIRAFRVLSSLLPLATHPRFTYGISDLPEETLRIIRDCFWLARTSSVRLSFHPDQFVLLGSPKAEVTKAAVRDLALHGELAETLGADVITIHGGGAYGDKLAALGRVARAVEQLPDKVRLRLSVENDDKVFHVRDLLPLCRTLAIPLTYDVHHHRCHPDGLTVAEATELAAATWNREPLFHVSSPKNGWSGRHPWRHADFVRRADFPTEWLTLPITVDVEAKAKEQAVLRLRKALDSG